MSLIAAALTGALTGLGAAALLHALDLATTLRVTHPALVWGLGPAGWFIAWLYGTYGRDVAGGVRVILDVAEGSATRGVPARMAPMIWLTTTLTHLTGGSAGREGSAVQIGGACAERVARALHLVAEERRTLLIAGASAGFAAAVGTPLAGVVFGFEVFGRDVVTPGRVGWRGPVAAAIPVFVGVAVAHLTSHLARTPHATFPAAHVTLSGLTPWAWAALAGLAFGLTARTFLGLKRLVRHAFARLPLAPPWRTAVGGLTLSLLLTRPGLGRYAGLGLDRIAEALAGPASWWDPALKAALTALTLGAGFRGGEFIPLVFTGTTLGANLAAHADGVPLAALGYASVFGAAARAPVACAVMAAELFGFALWPLALVSGLVAQLAAGPVGIYSKPTEG